jgi:hypothetical protein
MTALVIFAVGVIAFLLLCDAGFDVIIVGLLALCAAVAFVVFFGKAFIIVGGGYMLVASIVYLVRNKRKAALRSLLVSIGSFALAFFVEGVPWLK